MRIKRKELTQDELSQWIKQLIRDNNIHAFYICKPWLHLRAEVLEEQNHECQRCKAKGIYTEATTVHHIRPVRRYPRIALTKSNCEALCDSCHYDEHHKNRQKWDDERW